MNSFEKRGYLDTNTDKSVPNFNAADEQRSLLMEKVVQAELANKPELTEEVIQRNKAIMITSMTDAQLLRRFRESTQEEWTSHPDIFVSILEELETRGLAERS